MQNLNSHHGPNLTDLATETNAAEKDLLVGHHDDGPVSHPVQTRVSVALAWWLLLSCLTICLVAKKALWPSPEAAEPLTTVQFVVDINSAPQVDLEALPEIGPSLALRIIEYRESNGPFLSVEDLQHVRGFGKRTLEQLRPMLMIAPDLLPTQVMVAGRTENPQSE